MLINKREEDLTKTFERRWRASHNNDVKDAKDKQNEFNRKMFGTRLSSPKVLNSQEKLDNMNRNIEALKRNNRKF